MENPGKDEKKREREANWSTSEKELLRECIDMHLEVVENKGNDASMISKKKNAWRSIKENMASAGYYRDIAKLKSQWVRMKMSARKAVASVKRATVATGNSVVVPEISAENNLIQGMISHEFIEDDILIDSNCVDMFDHAESPISCEFLDCELLYDKTCSEESSKNAQSPQACIVKNDFKSKYPTTTPQQSSYAKRKIKTDSSSSAVKRLKNLPKTPSKNDIILERQRQITKESLYSEEISNLRKKQLIAEIEHMALMHKSQQIQQEELHSLKLQQLQMQIKYDEEIHKLKVEHLRKKCNE